MTFPLEASSSGQPFANLEFMWSNQHTGVILITASINVHDTQTSDCQDLLKSGNTSAARVEQSPKYNTEKAAASINNRKCI